MKLHVVIALALWVVACADTEQAQLDVPLHVAGTDVVAFETTRGVSVTLDRVDLAFGPLYLCSSVEAGEACDVARAEWLDAVVVDVLDATATEVGSLRSTTGSYRSFMFDLGISSLLTHDDALVSEAAQTLDANSIVIEGRVQLEGDETPFALALPIARTDDNELGVPVVRVRAEPASQHHIAEGDRDVTVRFDARPWLRGVDFAAVCADRADCAELSSESQAARAVRNALTAGEPPTLRWNIEE